MKSKSILLLCILFCSSGFAAATPSNNVRIPEPLPEENMDTYQQRVNKTGAGLRYEKKKGSDDTQEDTIESLVFPTADLAQVYPIIAKLLGLKDPSLAKELLETGKPGEKTKQLHELSVVMTRNKSGKLQKVDFNYHADDESWNNFSLEISEKTITLIHKFGWV